MESVKIRDGEPGDASDLAILADMATRGLTSFLWGSADPNGQSALSRCRDAIRSDAEHSLHYNNWRVAEYEGRIGGALNGYVIQHTPLEAPKSDIDAVLHPLIDLKNAAVGSWYTAAIAVFPEAQGKGVGSALLQDADARFENMPGNAVTLMFGSFNTGAARLYASLGYREIGRRTFVSFPGSDREGEWVFMSKSTA